MVKNNNYKSVYILSRVPSTLSSPNFILYNLGRAGIEPTIAATNAKKLL